jgi:hypothetical protein
VVSGVQSYDLRKSFSAAVNFSQVTLAMQYIACTDESHSLRLAAFKSDRRSRLYDHWSHVLHVAGTLAWITEDRNANWINIPQLAWKVSVARKHATRLRFRTPRKYGLLFRRSAARVSPKPRF